MYVLRKGRSCVLCQIHKSKVRVGIEQNVKSDPQYSMDEVMYLRPEDIGGDGEKRENLRYFWGMGTSKINRVC